MRNLYARSIGKPFAPLYVPAEQYAFYINFDTPISDPDFATFRLDVWKGTVLASANIGLLQQDFVSGTLYNMFSVFDFPALPNGYYQFVIYNTSDDTEKARSNYILVENDATLSADVPLVVYRNEANRNNINYESLTDFFNVFRLPLIKVEYQYELQKTQYRNASDKRLRNLRDFKYKFVKVEAYYFDEESHDAASELFECDGIYIDALKYVTKDAYNVANDILSLLAKGSVNMYIDDENKQYIFPITTRSVFTETDTEMAQKTSIKILDGSSISINWETDLIAGTAITYFARHGNIVDISEIDLINGKWTPNGAPSFEITKDVFGNIMTVDLFPQVNVSEFIFI